MDASQWPQEMGQLVKPHLDGLLPNTTNIPTATTTTNTASNTRPPQLTERRAVRPQKEQALKCPRCNSTNTKFCYYNNYSLTQPRYFCKTCRRYWTEGGTLRNVPVGGGSRKNKRSNTTNTGGTAVAVAATTSSTKPISISTTYIAQNPKFHEGQDLNLAFPHYNLQPEFGHDFNNHNTNSGALSAMELLRYGISGRGLGSTFTPMMPEGSGAYPSGFSLQDHLRAPTLSFPLDGIGGGGRGMLFPFEDLKQQVPSSTSTEQFEQNRSVQGAGEGSEVWNGIIGGGGSNW